MPRSASAASPMPRTALADDGLNLAPADSPGGAEPEAGEEERSVDVRRHIYWDKTNLLNHEHWEKTSALRTLWLRYHPNPIPPLPSTTTSVSDRILSVRVGSESTPRLAGTISQPITAPMPHLSQAKLAGTQPPAAFAYPHCAHKPARTHRHALLASRIMQWAVRQEFMR